MNDSPNTMRGVVHGKTIELEGDLNLPEGQPVTVIVQPLPVAEEALQQSFGDWATSGAELDVFLEGVQQGRRQDRPEIGP